MRKILLFLLMTGSGFAQTSQTYTGTIKDLSGAVVTSGQVNFTLAPPTDSTIPGVGRFTPTTIPCNINADGTLSGYVAGVVSGACVVTANISLSPSGTSYRICEQPYFATPGSCFFDYALGGTKDISSIAPTLSTGPINFAAPAGPVGPPGCVIGSTCIPADQGGIFNCLNYANLTNCLNAAKTYITTNESGSGHAAKIYIPEGTFALASPPYALVSGMSLYGVNPRMTADNMGQWGPSAQPNGGTWIDCGDATCFTANSKGADGYSGINMQSLGFKNWSVAILNFGGFQVGGLEYGAFRDIYGIGSTTIGHSDTGFIISNSADLYMSNINIINVNTGLTWINQPGTVPVDGGNSVINGFFTYAYPKSVANGNSTKPIYNLAGPNFLTFIRPQYFMASGGDHTSDGILISSNAAQGGNVTTSIHINSADLEGEVKNSVHLVGVLSNTIDIATVNQETWAVFVEGDSRYNTISCAVNGCPAFLDPSLTFMKSNNFHGQFDFTMGGSFVGNGSYFSSPLALSVAKANLGIFDNIQLSNLTDPTHVCADVNHAMVPCPAILHPIDFSDITGVVYTANKTIAGITSSTIQTIPAGGNISGVNSTDCVSKIKIQSAPTASTVFRLTDNGTQFGTATVAAGGFDATISIPSAVTINQADFIQVLAPASPDATAAGLIGSICATY